MITINLITIIISSKKCKHGGAWVEWKQSDEWLRHSSIWGGHLYHHHSSIWGGHLYIIIIPQFGGVTVFIVITKSRRVLLQDLYSEPNLTTYHLFFNIVVIPWFYVPQIWKLDIYAFAWFFIQFDKSDISIVSCIHVWIQILDRPHDLLLLRKEHSRKVSDAVSGGGGWCCCCLWRTSS